MSVNNYFRKILHIQSRIIIVITLVFVLTISTSMQLQQRSNALDLDELTSFKGLSNIGLNNNCVAFKCNNQQTVDNSKTVSNNTNSNIVSESDNTNIGPSKNTNQPSGSDPSPTCVECFENANLTSQQQSDLFSIIPGSPNSFAELCPLIKNTNAANFELALIEGALLTQDQAKALVDCLINAGILVG